MENRASNRAIPSTNARQIPSVSGRNLNHQASHGSDTAIEMSHSILDLVPESKAGEEECGLPRVACLSSL